MSRASANSKHEKKNGTKLARKTRARVTKTKQKCVTVQVVTNGTHLDVIYVTSLKVSNWVASTVTSRPEVVVGIAGSHRVCTER